MHCRGEILFHAGASDLSFDLASSPLVRSSPLLSRLVADTSAVLGGGGFLSGGAPRGWWLPMTAYALREG